jgi:hypothetical protein
VLHERNKSVNGYKKEKIVSTVERGCLEVMLDRTQGSMCANLDLARWRSQSGLGRLFYVRMLSLNLIITVQAQADEGWAVSRNVNSIKSFL